MKVDVLQCAGAHQSVTGPVMVLHIELWQILPYNNALAVAEQLDIQVGLVSHTWALPRANTGISTFPPAATQVCTCHNSHHARSAGKQGNKGMTTPSCKGKHFSQILHMHSWSSVVQCKLTAFKKSRSRARLESRTVVAYVDLKTRWSNMSAQTFSQGILYWLLPMIMILLLPQAADKGLMVLLLSEEKAQEGVENKSQLQLQVSSYSVISRSGSRRSIWAAPRWRSGVML
jgi:hypothetical protein